MRTVHRVLLALLMRLTQSILVCLQTRHSPRKLAQVRRHSSPSQLRKSARMSTRRGGAYAPGKYAEPDDPTPSSSTHGQIPPFLTKTYDIVDDPVNANIISWSADGQSFIGALRLPSRIPSLPSEYCWFVLAAAFIVH